MRKQSSYKVGTWFGEYEVYLIPTTYYGNKNLAIEMVCTDGEPFARLTVNLGEKLPPNMAYVDINNCDWAEEFIESNGIGAPTFDYKMSGYCVYPLYEFNLEKLG